MKTPPFAIAGALLLWSWQTGLWWLGAPLAAGIELSRFLPGRWELSRTEFNRLWDLCIAAFALYMLYQMAAEDGGLALGSWVAKGQQPQIGGVRGVEILRRLFRALPVCLAPMMLAQAWSRVDSINAAVFSWFLRKRFARTTLSINISWPYYAITLLGACAGDLPPWFLLALIALVAWSLWGNRGRSFHPAAWAVAYLLAAGLSLLGHAGLQPVATWFRELESDFLNQLLDRGMNANESRTSIGSVGVRKNSGAIVFRLQAEKGGGFPQLLEETVFDSYRNGSWVNLGGPKFEDKPPADGDATYAFSRGDGRDSAVRMWLQSRSRRLVPFLAGLRRLENVQADTLATNGLGVIRSDGLRFGAIRVVYGGASVPTSPPGEQDLLVPENETAVLDRVSGQLGLRDTLPVRERIGRVARFFGENFTYALYRGKTVAPRQTNSTLESFLLTDRRGHCEYFGTATTLLLRRAGIPARYVVGWAVPGSEPGGEWSLIRQRHAHAWTIAYVEGAWREIDNTPPVWEDMEEARKSRWETLRDGWQKTLFEWNRLRYGQASWRNWLLVPAVVMFAGFLIRFLWRRGGRGRGKAAQTVAAYARQGLDSEFYEVIRSLEKSGFERREGETLATWLRRIRDQNPSQFAGLDRLLALHYRLRFDPASLSADARRDLRDDSGAWLKQRR